LANTVNEEGTPPTQPPRLSLDDALVIWRAHDVHQVQAFFVGLVTLYVVLTLFVFLVMGRWYIGVAILGLQWVLLRCLLWALRWTFQRLVCWQEQHTARTRGPYADDHR
jgi:protein-S-isoprenylcysteine O-methyltransferase Ste14